MAGPAISIRDFSILARITGNRREEWKRFVKSNGGIAHMIAFGPVPSRRLGKSLGINNIPPKICSYSCIYCQLGSGFPPRRERGAFYSPERVYDEVRVKIEQAKRRDAAIDFLTFVSDGEPTLDSNLGDEIELLKPLNIKIAVISNTSLLSDESVRNDLLKADWVSLKMDSTQESVWRKINRPHKSLRLVEILDGASEFARIYRGELVTETMLVEDVNDGVKNMEDLAVFLERLAPAKALYIHSDQAARIEKCSASP